MNDLAQMYTNTLLTYLRRPPFATAYRESHALCLPHLVRALQGRAGEAELALLISRQIAVWQALDDQLAEFLRKHDYRFRDEAFDVQEQDAWRRAWETLSGRQRGKDENTTQT